MKRFCTYLLLIGLCFCIMTGVISTSDAATSAEAKPATKRIAVLYFEDHSDFDSSTGCGCVPGFIGKIFGGSKKHWDLAEGFETMLNRRLAETTVYEPVSQTEMLDAMAEMTLSRHGLKKLDKAQRATLAKHLNADVLVIGDIREFKQPRMKANASRSLAESGRESANLDTTASYKVPLEVLGYRYVAKVKLNMKFYNSVGNEIEVPQISISLNHLYAGTRLAALQASITEDGTNLQLGQSTDRNRRNARPIVKPQALDKIKFATPMYDKTLLGMATNRALIKVVFALRDNFGPNFITPWESAAADETAKKNAMKNADNRPIKITYIDSENPEMIYINAGSGRGLAINQQFAVWTDSEAIRDIDTGEILDYAKKRIATVVITEIRNDRLAIVKIVDKKEDLKRGDVLKDIPSDEGGEQE